MQRFGSHEENSNQIFDSVEEDNSAGSGLLVSEPKKKE